MNTTATDGQLVSVEDALERVMNSTDYDPCERKITAIKHLRALTGAGLKEAKAAIDEAVAGNGHAVEEVSLEDILVDLSRREGRAAPAESVPAASNGDDREKQREYDRRYRARIRARLASTRPPVRPTTTTIAWSLIETVPPEQLRQLLEGAGLDLEIVKRVADA
jgi:hypothetical protein